VNNQNVYIPIFNNQFQSNFRGETMRCGCACGPKKKTTKKKTVKKKAKKKVKKKAKKKR